MADAQEKQFSKQDTPEQKIKIVLVLSSSYLAAAILIVLLTGSLALLSEAGHMIADVGGLALALFAINYSRRTATPQRTYGFYRLEILASLVNSVVLILLSVYIVYEAVRRIFEPPEIQGFPLIIAAIVGIVVNFIAMHMLSSIEAGEKAWHHHGHKHYEAVKEGSQNHDEVNLNIKAAYLETLSDTLGAAGVVAAGVIILTTKFYLADPIISIGLALFMIPRTWSILKNAIHILMEGSPATIPHDIVKNAILQIKGVTGIFDLHVWTITSGMHALSAHVVVIDPKRSQAILQQINSILETQFKITHATIQIERYHTSEHTVHDSKF